MDSSSTVAFVGTHTNPVSHFVVFSKSLTKMGVPCTIFTDDKNGTQFDTRMVKVYIITPETDLAELADAVALFSSVVVDCGNPDHAKLFKALNTKRPTTRKWVYYDNQENRVPEPYPTHFATIAAVSDGVIFAAKRHLETGVFSSVGNPIPVPTEQIGLGFYPLQEARNIRMFREDIAGCVVARHTLFTKNRIKEKNQDIFVYLGGANDRYMEDFKFFLSLLPGADISNTVIVLQRHPKAEERGIADADAMIACNSSGNLPPGCFCIVSDTKATTLLLALAQGAIYAQTTMAPQCVLGKVPQVFKVTAQKDPDCLIRAGFQAPTTAEELTRAFRSTDSLKNTGALVHALKIDPKCMRKLRQLAPSIA